MPAPRPDAEPFLLARLPAQERARITWLLDKVFPAIVAASSVHQGVQAACKTHSHPGLVLRPGTLRRWFDAYAQSGDWLVLADLRQSSAFRRSPEPTHGLPADFIEHWRGLCESNQRSSKPAWRALIRQWRRWSNGRDCPIPGYSRCPAPAAGQHIPTGWGYSNLMRYQPTPFELTVARQGRSAAASQRRLVYTTRADLWVGSHYLFDDLWHDHFVNVLDTRKTGRPLEFHGLDLYSACKFAWGMHVRTGRDDGTMEGLNEAGMRCLLAYVLGEYGYSPQGTVLVVEHGTAAVRESIERLLHDLSGGKITVERSGMEGAAAHAGQYAGRSKGNFRFKAPLESLGNLVHNELADSLTFPGQTGLSVERRPEQLHGLLKHNDALLDAFVEMAQTKPELARQLALPLLEFRAFQEIAECYYAYINHRTQHELEGWDRLCVPDPVTNTMRRLSPWEVWTAGRRRLVRLPRPAVALLLGHDFGQERRLLKGRFEFDDKAISSDPLRFDAVCSAGFSPSDGVPDGLKAGLQTLRDGQTYLTVLNPFAPGSLFVFDAHGRLLDECPRIWRVSRLDQDALHREMGRVAHEEKELIGPVARRGAAFTRKRIADSRHNAAIVDKFTRATDELAAYAEKALDAD